MEYKKIATNFIRVNKITIYSEHKLFNGKAILKKYIKSVFGASSPQFAQVKGIQFKIIKN